MRWAWLYLPTGLVNVQGLPTAPSNRAYDSHAESTIAPRPRWRLQTGT